MHRLSVITVVIGLLAAVQGLVAPAWASSPAPAPSTAPSGAAGRFVLPEGGYAVTFPVGWEVLVLPVDWASIPVVRAEAGRDGEVSDGVTFCEVKVAGPCEDEPGRTCVTAVDELATWEAAWWGSRPDTGVPPVVVSEAVALPAGHAMRIDVTLGERDTDRSIYYLTDGRVIATLLCMAARGPEDRWRSVAETFEFLAGGRATSRPGPTEECRHGVDPGP